MEKELLRRQLNKMIDKVFVPKYSYMLNKITVYDVSLTFLPSIGDEYYFITMSFYFHQDIFQYTDKEGALTDTNIYNQNCMDAILSDLFNTISYIIPSDNIYLTAMSFYDTDGQRHPKGHYKLEKEYKVPPSDIERIIDRIKYAIEWNKSHPYFNKKP